MSLQITKPLGSFLRDCLTRALVASVCFGVSSSAQQSATTAETSKNAMSVGYSRLPLTFEQNMGQADARAKYISRGPGYMLFLTNNEAVIALSAGKGKQDIVRLRLVGSNSRASSEGQQLQPGKTNYFIGNDPSKWRTNVANYGRVRYANTYPGIDLLYYGQNQTLEHDFIVAPGADPGRIKLQIDGTSQIRLADNGDLILQTRNGELRLAKPMVYQTTRDGSREEIAAGYELTKRNRVQFRIGAYDRNRELVIDPVLNYSTYFGGDATTTVSALTLDSAGNAYFTGSTASSSSTLAGTACASCGTPDRDGTTKLDVFVAKLNPSGTALTFTTIVGGTGDDQAHGIAVDASNNIYVTGETAAANFPTTAGAFNTAAGNNAPDAFAFKLQSTGATLDYSTYLNGGAVATDHADIGRGIAVDANGLIYATGSTASTTFFPAAFVVGIQVANADNTGATTDAFLVKLNPAGTGSSDLVYGTYFGGGADDGANTIALLSASHAMFGGFAASGFPVGGGSSDTSLGGTQDGFITNLPVGGGLITSITCQDNNPTNLQIDIVTSTPHGLVSGDNFTISDVGNSANITFNGNETAGAGTGGTTISYTTNASCNNRVGQTGVITAGLSKAVGRRKFSTFLGGDVTDEVKAIALDGSGNVYATGSTNSVNNFPNAANTIQSTGLNTTGSGAETDAFVAKLSGTTGAITYSAYLGGTGNDVGNAIVVNPTCTAGCEAYVAGTTASATRFNSNSLQSAISGTQDGFAVRVNSAGNGPLIYSTYFGGSGTDSIVGAAAQYVGTAGTTNSLFVAANSSTGIGAASTFGSTASVTSSAAQTTPDGAATGSVVIAKLSGNNVANPSLGIGGNKNTDPIGQSTAFTSAVTYTWTVTNTNAAKAVSVDVPMPQSGGADLLSITGTPAITGTGSGGSCTKRVGSATAPGGMTCNLGDLTAAGNSTITVIAAPTAAAHCANTPCAVPSFSQTGKVASAEIGSLVTSAPVVSNLAPVVDLAITGTAVTDVGGDAVYVQGTDTSLTYNITVTNNSSAPTIAANSGSLDVLIESDYPANYTIATVNVNGGGAAAPDTVTPPAQGTQTCYDDTANHKLQCNLLSIAANPATATLVIVGSLSPAPNNPALSNLITTTKFPPSDTSEIFTVVNGPANGNTGVAINVNYSGPTADLQVTSLADAPDPVRTGQNIVYTLNYVNAGPTDATNVTITQSFSAPVPANVGKFTFVSNTPGTGVAVVCTQPGGTGTNVVCPIDNTHVTAASGPQSFTITGTLALDATVPFVNQASAAVISTTGATSEPLGGTANNTANASTHIFRDGKLSVSGFAAPATVADGQNVAYTFNVSNPGLDNATSTVVTLSMPQNTGAVNFTGNGFVVPTACTGTTTVNCTIGTIVASASNVAITVTATPPALATTSTHVAFTGSITGIASPNVEDGGGTKTSSTLTTFVERMTTLSIGNLLDSPDPQASTGNITYTVDLTNTGTNGATNVKLDFALTTGFTLVTPSAATCPAIAGGLRCNVPSVPNSGTTTFTLVITPSATLVPSNQSNASATSQVTVNTVASTSDLDSGTGTLSTGTVTTTVERRADLQMFNLTATSPVSSDGNITVQAQVQNLSGATATSVQVVFTFDHNYRFVSGNVVNANGVVNTPAFTCTVTFTATTRTCTLPDLPINKLYTFNVIVQPQSGIVTTNNPAGNSTTVNVSATISGSVVEPAVDTNANTISNIATTVTRSADLAASGTNTSFGPSASINASGVATYNLQVINNGPDPVDGSQVVFTFRDSGNALLSGFTNFDGSLSAGLGACLYGGGSTVTCTMAANFGIGLANVRSGTIKLQPPASVLGASTQGTYNVVASVSSTLAFDNGVNGAPGGNNSSASVTTTVQRQADLEVVSVAAPLTAATGTTVTYVITARNNGPDTASNVRITDVLPTVTNGSYVLSSATFTTPDLVNHPSGTGNCTGTTTQLCDVGTLAVGAGQDAVITISGVANIDPAQNTQDFVNAPSISTSPLSHIEVGAGLNTRSATTHVGRSADLQMVSVTSTPLPGGNPGDHFIVGQHTTLKYDITVTNANVANASDATGVFVTDQLPAQVTFQSSPSGCTAVAQNVTCNIAGTITKGSQTTVTIIVTPVAAQPTPNNTANISNTPVVGSNGVSELDPSNNANVNNQTVIDRVSNLGVTLTGPVVPVPVFAVNPANFTYTITATNAGPSKATGVVVTDPIPAGLTAVGASWPAVTGTPSGVCTAPGGTVTCNLNTMDVNGPPVVITLTVKPSLSTALSTIDIVNNVFIASGNVIDNSDPFPHQTDSNSDSHTVTLRGRADVGVVINTTQTPHNSNAPAGAVLVGDQIVYTVTVGNFGPYPAGGNITLTDTIPAGVNLVSVNSTSFTCNNTTTCTLGALASGSFGTVTITTDVPPGVVAGQTAQLSNTAIVTQYDSGNNLGADVTDPAPANNTANNSITARASADMAVNQTAPASVLFANPTSFTVTVNNIAGRSSASNVVVSNALVVSPLTSVNSVTATPSQGTCQTAGLGTGGATVTCNLGAMASSASATINLSMTPIQAGSIANTPTVTATEIDPSTANNSPGVTTITVNNSPPGQGTVHPVNLGTGTPDPNVSITSFVTNPGTATLTITPTGPSLPLNYVFGSTGASYYNIASTASSNPPIVVCINYAPTTFHKPERVRLFVVTGGTGIDTTIPVGFTNNTVCGNVSTIPSSPIAFAVLEPVNHAPVAKGVVVAQSVSGKGSAGQSLILDSTATSDADSDVCTVGNSSTVVCSDKPKLIYTWTGNFTDGNSKTKDCNQVAPFGDNLPCTQVAVSVPFGSQTFQLTATDPQGSFSTDFVPFSSTGGSVTGSDTQTVSQGQSATFRFSYDYNANTTFSVTGAPSLAANQITCSVSPPSVTFTGGAGTTQSAIISVLCSTSAPTFAMKPANENIGNGTLLAGIVGITGLPLIGLFLMPSGSRRRRKMKMTAMLGVLLFFGVFMTACGGGSGGFGGAPKQVSAGTAKGDYTITVTAVPAPTASIPAFTLKVQ